jgi:hypothetical protein
MRARGPLPFALALALALALLAPGAARAKQELPVVVVPGLELADLAPYADDAAIGLLVPGAGPRISEESALAALERGAVRNSLRGGLPTGPAVIETDGSSAIPAGPAIVLGLPIGGDQPNDRRYPIAVLAPGFEGLLTSERTRIPGLVSIADVAPSALGADDGLASRAEEDPQAVLVDLDNRIEANGESRYVVALAAAILILGLSVVYPRAALLGFATALAANLVLGAAGVSELWVVLLVVAIAVGLGAPALAAVSESPLVVGLILAGIVVAYLVALVADGAGVALSPLGPTQNARFYGLSNLLAAMILVPALGGIVLLRITIGWLPALALAAASLVAVAGSRFGADGGTGIVLCVAIAVLAVELADERRGVAVAVIAGTLVAALVVVAVDALSGVSTHLTDAVGGGPGSLADDLRDRIALSWHRAVEHWYTVLLVVLGIVVLVLLVWRLLTSDLPRTLRSLPLSLAAAVGVSLLVNDSPLDVVATGLVAVIAAQAYVERDPELAGFR